MKSFIDNLESFKIYDDLLVAKDSELMTNILVKNIRALKSQMQNKEANMKQIGSLKYNTNYIPSQVMKLIEHMGQRTNEILDAYDIPELKNISDSEFIHIMNNKDNMKLLGNILSSSNLKLYIETDINKAVEDYKIKLKEKEKSQQTKQWKKNARNTSSLKNIQIIDDLESDNETEIYYDLEYDNTPYILKEEYGNEYKTMTDEEFLMFLSKKLIDNLGYDELKSRILHKIL